MKDNILSQDQIDFQMDVADITTKYCQLCTAVDLFTALLSMAAVNLRDQGCNEALIYSLLRDALDENAVLARRSTMS